MWSLYLGVLISACIAKKPILWICYLASFSLIQATSDVCVMAHTMCPCCPFPCLSSLSCMFLCVIIILRTRKCRCLTILSFLLLKDVFCCLCTLSSFLPIALKTLPFTAEISPWVILLQFSFVISACVSHWFQEHLTLYRTFEISCMFLSRYLKMDLVKWRWQKTHWNSFYGWLITAGPVGHIGHNFHLSVLSQTQRTVA